MEVRLNGNAFYHVTAEYGSVDSVHTHAHNGIDLAMKCGSHLNSPTDGVIEGVVNYGSTNIGKGVIIKTDDGEHLILGHLSDNSHVHEGQTVHMGDYIADTGTTGHSTGCHLHVGLRDSSGHFVSPDKFFNGLEQHMAKIPETVQSAGEILHNALSEYADTLAHLGLNLISSINWDFIIDALDIVCSIFIL